MVYLHTKICSFGLFLEAVPPWYGNFRNGHFEHGRINFLSCIYWVNILRNFGIFLCELVYLFRNFGILALKNSGNPALA